jgi:hypothetical protein
MPPKDRKREQHFAVRISFDEFAGQPQPGDACVMARSAEQTKRRINREFFRISIHQVKSRVILKQLIPQTANEINSSHSETPRFVVEV